MYILNCGRRRGIEGIRNESTEIHYAASREYMYVNKYLYAYTYIHINRFSK